MHGKVLCAVRSHVVRQSEKSNPAVLSCNPLDDAAGIIRTVIVSNYHLEVLPGLREQAFQAVLYRGFLVEGGHLDGHKRTAFRSHAIRRAELHTGHELPYIHALFAQGEIEFDRRTTRRNGPLQGKTRGRTDFSPGAFRD